MELELLGIAGIATFLVGGAAVMIVSAFKRTIELRGALIQSMRRIDRLEAAIVRLGAGHALAPGELAPPEPVESRGDAAPRRAETPISFAPASFAPSNFTTAPDDEAAPAPEPIPFREQRLAVHAKAAQAKAEAGGLTAASAETTQRSTDSIEPPHVGVVAFIAVLAAGAALAAAQVGALIAPAGVGAAMLVGLGAMAAAEWRRAFDLDKSRPITAILPSQAALTALLGASVMLVAALYGLWALKTTPPWAAFAVAGVLAIAALGVSILYGPYLIAFGLAVAALAPALAPHDGYGAWASFTMLAIVLGLAMTLARMRDAPVWAWLAGALALAWAARPALAGETAPQLLGACAFLALLAAAAAMYAWRDAREPLPYPRFWAEGERWGEPLGFAATLHTAAALGLLATLLSHPAQTAFAGAALVALVTFAAAAAILRPGFWPVPHLAGLVAAAAIAFWPAPAGGVVDAPGLAVLASVIAFALTAGGAAMMARGGETRPGALLAGLGPIAILAAAHTRFGGFGAPLYWAAAAAIMAALNFAAYAQLMKSKPSAAYPFSAGAALALVALANALAPPSLSGIVLAAALPALALALRLREDAGLRLAALILCPLVLTRLIVPELFIATASAPIALALRVAPAIMAALLAALMFDPLRARRTSAETEASLALALALFAAATTLIARHIATAGAIAGPYGNLVEMGVNTLVWLGLACVLTWRLGPKPRPFFYVIELAAFAAAATHALLAGLALIAPWWGLAPAPAPVWNGVSAVLFAYGAPAALFLGYARERAGRGQTARANFAAATGLVLVLAGLVLELRRLFHGGAMAAAPVTQSEAWAYSLALLGFAGVLTALSLERRSQTLAYAALSLALAALAKTALFDVASLGLAIHMLALALAAVLGAGLYWGFRRYVIGAPPLASAGAGRGASARVGALEANPPA